MRAALTAAAAVCLLLAVAQGRAQPPQVSPAQTPRAQRIHADVRAILSSPAYQVRKVEAPLLARIGRRIGDALDRFFNWLARLLRRLGPGPDLSGSSAVLPRIIAATLVTGMVIALAWLTVVLVKYLRRQERKPRRKKTPVEEEPAEADDPADVPVDAWLDAARRHAASGDFRKAYRAVFLAMLLRMDRAGAIEYRRSRTNGEYLRALRERPELLACARPVALSFDARWYGQQPIGSAEYEAIIQGYRAVAARLEPIGEPG